MRPDLGNYGGREQAYVKHHFLADYVDGLVYKVASAWPEVVYIDGFSGPWLEQTQDFSDTSFGMALGTLLKAKLEWKRLRGRDVRMTALLVERDPEAFARLQSAVKAYPDINVQTFNGDFVNLVPHLIRAIPSRAFTFVLMDPKGWKIDMAKVAPLIARQNTEVVFNFMFTMINWAASMRTPGVQSALNLLMPDTDWKRRLDAIVVGNEDAAATARKDVLVSCIGEVIGRLGGFPHVMETPVFFPTKERTFYSLIYATRADKGVEVFRQSQYDALEAQDKMRNDKKIGKRDEELGMTDMFAGSLSGNEFGARWRREQEAGARATMLEIIPPAPSAIRFGDLCSRVMSRFGVRKRRMGRLAAEMREAGEIRFLDWASRKQVPDDDYRVTR